MFRHFRNKDRENAFVKTANEIDYDDGGNAIIDMSIEKEEDFFSPYCHKKYELINTEVDAYLKTSEQGLPALDDIAIHIYTKKQPTKENEERICSAVKRHYAEELVFASKSLKNNIILGIVFSILGLVLLFVGAVLNQAYANYYLDSVAGVVGWLFLWDGMEIIFYDQKELIMKKRQSRRLMNAKIVVKTYDK